MNVEDLLTRALAEEAESREVNVAALHQEVLHRLPATQLRRVNRPLLTAAAAFALIATGTATGFVLISQDGGGGTRFADDSQGDVATEFACPQVNTIDFRTTKDDGFLPDLSGGTSPAEVARLEHAPTYEFITSGDTATLRLGNADGSLGSITTYALVAGDWEMRTARVCAGAGDLPLAPAEGVLRLGEHGSDPWPAEKFFGTAGLQGGFVDDRPYYNLAGVIEGHRSMYVQPCGTGWCWASGEPDSFLQTGRLPSSLELGRPHDVSDLLVNPDMMVGRDNPYGIWAHDVTGPDSFTAILRDGTRIPAVEVTRPEWGDRRMLVVLAVQAEVVRLELRSERGSTTTWDPDEIPDD